MKVRTTHRPPSLQWTNGLTPYFPELIDNNTILIDCNIIKIANELNFHTFIASQKGIGILSNLLTVDSLNKIILVNCCENENCIDKSDFLGYFHIKLHDDLSDIIDISIIKQLCEYIKNLATAGTNIVFHCKEGISRSPAVFIAWLLIGYNINNEYKSIDHIIHSVKEQRKCVCMNTNFICQISKLFKGENCYTISCESMSDAGSIDDFDTFSPCKSV